jgi:two-component system chemotaxis sensor kinase CheA
MMDKKESEFLAKLLETFKIEAEDHLNALSAGLLSLEKEVSEKQKKELIETIFREAHSLKGAARAVNFDSIQNICQSLETVLAAWKQKKLQLSRESFDILYASIDLILKLIQLPQQQETRENMSAQTTLIRQLEQLLVPKENKEIPKAVSPEQVTKPQIIPSTTPQIPEPTAKQPLEAAEKPLSTPASPTNNEHDKTIRVSQRKLDQLFQQVEEMLMLKLSARQQINDLKYMQEQIKQWDKKWSGIQSDYFALREGAERNFNSLSKSQFSNLLKFVDWQQQFMKTFKEHLNNLSKMSTQDFRQAGGIVDTLIDDTRRILMQPFSVLLEIFPRMVRDISLSQNKEVRFEVVRGEIEVDRRVLEEMKDPLIHLIRNSIDHGIELPEVRLKQNKPSCGSIKIIASELSGNSMEILIIDDGQGVNLAKVKDSAIKLGLITDKEALTLSEQEILMLIFQPELSTSSIITEISGRGVGLEVVAEKVDKLGGQISIETKAGIGTTFRIILPLTLTTFRGMRLKVCDINFIMPSHNIKRIIRLKPETLKSVEGRQMLTVDKAPIAYVSLNDILQIPKKAFKSHNYAIIIKAGEKTIALGIDEAICEQEMLVKPFGSHLKRIRNILGATITESGEVILILNPLDLIKSSIKAPATAGPSRAIPKSDKMKKKNILVVEDSMTSRMLLKNILETAGYEVKTAVDGLEGLSLFKIEPFDLILTDIEMPNMDGFTMTSKVRNFENGRTIPIVLCTSRNTPADKERGIDVGANAYLEKNQFTQSKFLEVIKKLL